MSRFAATLVAAVLMLGTTAAMSACGGDDENDDATATIEATEPTESVGTGSGGVQVPSGKGGTQTVDLSDPNQVEESCKQIPGCKIYPPSK